MSNLFQSGRVVKQKVLFECKAGKLTKEGTLVSPIKTRGKLIFFKEDSLLHFQWFSREDDKSPADDLIIFPDEAQFKHVEKVKDGFVFYLDFNGSRQQFYWLQEFKEEKDSLEYLVSMNKLLGNSPPKKDESMNIYDKKAPIVGQSDVLKALSSMGSQNELSLSSILNSDRVATVLAKYPEISKELVKFLPDGTKPDVASVIEHVRSPQFSKTVRVIDEALRSGHLYGFCQSLGLDPNLGLTGGVEAFIKAFNKKNQDQMDESK